MHAIENQYTEFVLDALRDPQPVQIGEQRRDVVVKLCPDCKTCGGINDSLQSVQFTAWPSGKGVVAVIQLDITKLETSVNTDSLGSKRRMLRICRRTPKHV